MEKNFKKSFLQNASIAFILQVINILVTFIVRTVFVKTLGNDYLSLNGLFTNVVSLLSFAELGIGNAIIFSLYEPIAMQNTEKINTLMHLFKKAYRWIRFIIAILGICILPFINHLVNDVNVNENFQILYILFLINTYVSYFFAYKKSLLIADQKNYIAALIQQSIIVVQSVIQCIIILLFHNYVLYLWIQIIGTTMINIITSGYVDRHYKYLKQDASKLDKREYLGIFENIKNIFCYKIGAVILNSTDNILISSLITTRYVGLYSNYSMIISALNGVLMQVCNSIAATIGIYNVQNDDEKNGSTFRYIFFISYWVFGVCTICLIELLNSFISIWIGDTYLLNFSTVVIISIVFYITGINQIPSQYRTSFGIFKQAKMIPLLASVINIILSIVLGKIIGLNGIFIATIIAKLVTFNIMDPLLIYKNGFKKESISFFYSKIKYFIVLVITFLGVHLINDFLHVEGILGFVVRGAITFCITNLLLAILLYRDNEFKQLLRRGVKNGKS